MAFHQRLNQVVDYLEAHLDSEINYLELAQLAGTSVHTLQRVFPLFADMTIADYVRRRRLTLAGRDLAQTNLRVADLAAKYGYTSAAAFSRAFSRFHGLQPRAAKLHHPKLKYYPKLVFGPLTTDHSLEYEIVQLQPLELCGIKVSTDESHIRHDAPYLFAQALQRYAPTLGFPEYGMIAYNDTRCSSRDYEYWVLWSTSQAKQSPGLLPYAVSAKRWLKFSIPSQKATDIQAMSDLFYKKFLPTCSYQLSIEPELEHYHDGITDFLIPIK